MNDVLFFLPSLGNGGAESHTLRVINHLDRSRFRPSVALGRIDGSYQGQLAADVDVHHVSSHRVGSSTARMLLAAAPLRRIVQRHHPSVVCAVMEAANLIALSALASLRSRPGLVILVQAPPTRNFQGKTLEVVLAGIRHLYPRADAVVALSQGVADELVAIEPTIARRIHVIHNACVDARITAAANLDRARKASRPRPVVLACGRLVPQKGFDDLLRSFAMIVHEVDAELWIAGDGPLRGDLTRLIGALGLGGRVRLLGFQSSPEWLMARADVFVLSSVFEGFGNVLVEAMAVGTPVVSTACPFGPDEIITDGRDGLLVPVGQPESLARSVVSVLRDDALRARLGAAGAERARAFGADVIASRYGAVFEAAAAGCGDELRVSSPTPG